MRSTCRIGIVKNQSKYNLLEMKDYILSKASFDVDTAIILGSGMGAFADRLNNPINISYNDIPDYPLPTVKGHSGELSIGSIRDISLVVAKGRFHYYEGYDIETIALPVRLFHSLGIKKLSIVPCIVLLFVIKLISFIGVFKLLFKTSIFIEILSSL